LSKIKLNIKNKQIAKMLKSGDLKNILKKNKIETKKPADKVNKTIVNKKHAAEVTAQSPVKRKLRIIYTPKVEAEKEVFVNKNEKEPVNTSPKNQVPPINSIQDKKIPKQDEVKAKVVKKEEAVKPTVPPKEPAKEVFNKVKKAKVVEQKKFDSRARRGLISAEDERWRKIRRFRKKKEVKAQIEVVRPTNLKIKIPITVKDLANLLKLKASEIIAYLFKQGIVMTINDFLEDETIIQLIAEDFKCEILIDKKQEQRLRITDNTTKEEIKNTKVAKLKKRPPIITFMGHVDHGKTSIIDRIRQSNRVASEAGSITQHIGAFKAKTASGEIVILDTPGHEAFHEMRSRGANVTDIVVLVIAGDEGIKEQTLESIHQIKAIKIPVIIAINKSDKEGFDVEKIYRQLADNELLPEAWGGDTITINCSAITGDGVPDLLEMIALQSEILELKANYSARARGVVLESQMHKGFGAVATVLVQNGVLHKSDSIVLGYSWGKVKTMHDENNVELLVATPSIPIKLTGLSSVAVIGDEFIVVDNEKEAKSIANARKEEMMKNSVTRRSLGYIDKMLKREKDKKVLNIIIKADVQGSLEAIKTSLLKIESKKIDVNIIKTEIGEISESDVELAEASNSIIVSFNIKIDTSIEDLSKKFDVKIITHNIIYHLIDDIKNIMLGSLDKLREEVLEGKVKVKTVFKSSKLGNIAGCEVVSGRIVKNDHIKLMRNDEQLWEGNIISLQKEKDLAKEVKKGNECGVVLENFSDVEEGDILNCYNIIYKEQAL